MIKREKWIHISCVFVQVWGGCWKKEVPSSWIIWGSGKPAGEGGRVTDKLFGVDLKLKLPCYFYNLSFLMKKKKLKTPNSQRVSLVAQMVKHLSAMQGPWVQSLGREDPLEKEMATHSTTLAWKIPWTEKPGRLQSMGSQRVGHNWVTSLTHNK